MYSQVTKQSMSAGSIWVVAIQRHDNHTVFNQYFSSAASADVAVRAMIAKQQSDLGLATQVHAEPNKYILTSTRDENLRIEYAIHEIFNYDREMAVDRIV